MEVKEFTYHEKTRNVIIFKEGPTTFEGIDLLYVTDESDKKKCLDICKDLVLDKDGKIPSDKYQELKPYFKYWRKFRK